MVKIPMSEKNAQSPKYRCFYCNDNSDSNSNVKEELVALIEPKLQVVEGSDYGDLNLQITDFIIHDQHGPCSLDQGLIEAGEPVFVCGRLLNICDDREESFPAKMIGPVNEWWFSGFDGTATLLVGIESPYSSYLLQNPHFEYKQTFEKLESRMFLTKFVIEILQQNPNISFASLISKLNDKSQQFDTEFLISNIRFLIDHIANYDSCCDSDEIRLCETEIFKIFHDISKGSNLRIDQPVECCSGLSGVNTENSRNIFNQLWNNIFDNHATNFCVSANESNLEAIERGKFVKFETDGHRQSFGRIISKDPDHRSYHIDLFVPGKDTLLGKTSSQNLLFAVEKCLNIDLSSSSIVQVIEVRLATSFDDWNPETELDQWICWQIYDDQRCTFKSIPSNYLQECDTISCLGCLKSRSLEETKPEYSSGDCVLIASKEIQIPINNYFENTLEGAKVYDSNVYPEKFRKRTFNPQNDNYETEDLVSGYTIGYIDNVILRDQNQKYFQLKLFYKPENIFPKYEDFIKCDPNLLFWSNQDVQVDSSLVLRKCKVIYSKNVSNSMDQEEFFYFNLCYDPDNGEFREPTAILKSRFNNANVEELKFDRNLTILDLFSGCGGLSFGFAPLASRLYGIEKEKSAAQTYKLNFKDSLVFNADANSILKTLIDQKDGFLTMHLPPKGSIDMIISGPPCQGFSEMNRFSSSEYSLFKRSFVGCFLNYLDYYHPKYFLFENVSNIIHYGKSLLFQTICSFMIHSGYQIRIAILQAGCYGLPQNRRRLFIWGSRNNLALPEFPFPTHLFARNKSRTSFKIGNMRFDPFDGSKGTLRMVTIEEAIGDLPELNQDDYALDIPREYTLESPVHHYQKMLRGSKNHLIRDHCCRMMSQLNLERIKRIPLEVGSDWRDLPNLEIQLENGKLVKKLKYTARAKKSGQNDRNTLIPRCLVHTANKNNNWKGVFGRLSWRGYFPTIVTNPDPISAQGKTIHPSQHRVISVREMARSQGFPDNFIFFGSKSERYSQIGNAVPPILSRKLAQQFRNQVVS